MWKVAWLVVESAGKRTIPAFEFLRSIDSAPKIRLLQVFEAVRAVGPHRWKDTQSHDKMEGELDDVHELRDRHDQILYRVYLKWSSATSTVWVLDGRTKANNTKLPNAAYKEIRAMADLVDGADPPAATADDVLQSVLLDEQ